MWPNPQEIEKKYTNREKVFSDWVVNFLSLLVKIINLFWYISNFNVIFNF